MSSAIIALILSTVLLQEKVVADEQLTSDINAIVELAKEDSKGYVAVFLLNGAPATGATFVASSIARNELNVLSRDKRLVWPLVRTMRRFADSREFADNTRQYAFAILTRLAANDGEVAKTVVELAENISQRQGDVLQRAAVSFLQDNREKDARKLAPANGPVKFVPIISENAVHDPRQQSEPDRLASLRQSMEEAIKLLKAGDDQQFFNRFIDPFWVARHAADVDKTEDEVLGSLLNNTQRAKEFRQQMISTLENEIAKQPKWLLEGRAASFISPRGGSHTAEFWIHLDGMWKISPET
jgi:hypothetical protein